jgi:5'(3')-deoxyribonucleotidase
VAKPSELIALIDMDGTVADFDGQMKQDLATLASPEEGRTLPTSPDDTQEPAWLVARKRLIKSVPGWWENLPVHEPGRQIVQILADAGFDLMVLTKGPYQATHAWAEKVAWCRKHLPGVPVTITEDKGLVYGKVLVDDWPPYGLRWLEWRPRGLLIIPAQPWNRLDQYPAYLHGNLFRYTGPSDRDALVQRLSHIRSTIG